MSLIEAITDAICIVALALLCISFVIFIPCLIHSYYIGLNKEAPTLSRNHIKAIYGVNSKRIHFKFNNDTYYYRLWILRAYNEKLTSDPKEDMFPFDIEIPFNVNFIDWLWLIIKYKKYKKGDNKKTVTSSKKENLEKIIKCIQFDIDTLKEQSEEQLNTAKNITENIYNNLRK